MDMSDVNRSAAPHPPTPGDAADTERWRDLISAIGSEIAGPLTAALERINSLTSTGKIDRASLRSLRDEVEAARHAGMIAQQLARFAPGRGGSPSTCPAAPRGGSPGRGSPCRWPKR